MVLVQEIPGYAAFAPTARANVEELVQHRTDDYVNKIEKNLGLVVCALQVEVAALRTQLREYQTTLLQSTQMVQEVCSTMRMTVQASVTRQQSTTCTVLAKFDEQNRSISQVQETQQLMMLLLQQQNQQNQRRDPIMAVEPTHQSTVAGLPVLPAFRDFQNVQLLLLPGEQRAEDAGLPIQPSYSTRNANIARDLGVNALGLLRNEPRVPVLVDFPRDWPAFLADWNLNDLQSFIGVSTREWNSSRLTQRFVKRHRGIKCIRRFQQQHNYHDEVEAAGRLEEIRINLRISLSKHITDLFLTDGDVRRRVRLYRNREQAANDSD